MSTLRHIIQRSLKRAALGIAIAALVPFVLFLLYIAALFVASGFNLHFLAIDQCLDSGGAWDYKAARCSKDA